MKIRDLNIWKLKHKSQPLNKIVLQLLIKVTCGAEGFCRQCIYFFMPLERQPDFYCSRCVEAIGLDGWLALNKEVNFILGTTAVNVEFAPVPIVITIVSDKLE